MSVFGSRWRCWIRGHRHELEVRRLDEGERLVRYCVRCGKVIEKYTSWLQRQ